MIKYNYNSVKKIYEDAECVLLEKCYISKRTKMKFICKCKNECCKTFESFLKNQKCKKCNNNYNYNYSYNEVKNYFEENDCVLLEESYTNARQPLKYICSCKNESVINFHHFKSGVRCKKSANKKQENNTQKK